MKRRSAKNIKPPAKKKPAPKPVKKPAPVKRSPQSSIMDPEIKTRLDKFAELATPIRSNDHATMQRIALFVSKKTGLRLQAYLDGPAPIEEKKALLDELIEIVEKKEYDRLPKVPGGQTQGDATPSTPAPVEKAAPPAEPATAPEDVVIEDEPPAGAGASDEEDPNVKALIAAAKRLSGPKGLTEKQVIALIKEEVPKLVRAELRVILKGVGDALKATETK